VEVYDESGKLLRSYKNLIKETIFDSTMALMGRKGSREQGKMGTSGSGSGASLDPSIPRSLDPFCLSVFKDNAGVVAFDDLDAVCFKVETHNHPSAIEPYGGSATGAGGVIRDILGTGLAAKPIANTDVFCVAYPAVQTHAGDRYDPPTPLPKGVIHPRRVLQQVVAGVRDYGNRMGIPTVSGGVWFDEGYTANPLVYAGTNTSSSSRTSRSAI
jgi:phosphoribosylformylglycinamidine (FGAM) synthase-like enzyme